MYLTRMMLNPARRGTRELVSSPQRMHAAVLSAFPPAEETRRILWRLDQDAHNKLALLVMSGDEPRMQHIAEVAGWDDKTPCETADYEPFLTRLTVGERWIFRLTANPVKAVRTVPGQRGKRVSVGTPSKQVNWLVERAGVLGFRIPEIQFQAGTDGEYSALNLRVSNRRVQRFARQGGEVTLATAQFDGLLEVTDVERLQRALTAGVGKAKAYGCGLLTLARP